jgi:hypothetical protein
MELGLVDPDATVRRTSAAALGSAGPGGDVIVARLKSVLVNDVDAKVRQTAAKSIVDLDETSAAKNLLPQMADDPEIWRLFRDRLIEDVRRRDKTPERVFAASDVLAGAGLNRLAIDLLTQVSAARDGLWEGDGGRGAVLERLAALLLDVGDPDAAKSVAQECIDGAPRDAAAPRARAELLLAMARCRGGRLDELRVARRSLEALRASEALPRDRRAEAEVELGDCLLRLDDPVDAKSTLAAACAKGDMAPRLAKKAEMLLDDARRRVDEERKRVLAWIDAMDGDGAAEARSALREFGVRGAPYVLDALDDAKAVSRIRALLRVASIVAGRTFVEPAENAPAADLASAVTDARSALRAAIERAAGGASGVR